MEYVGDSPPTLSYLKGERSRLKRQAVNEWWQGERPGSYTRLDIPPRIGVGPEMRLRRTTLGKLVSARTGHGDFVSYRTRMNLQGNQLDYCLCGEEKEPTHFYRCPVAWEAWKGVKKKKPNFPVRGKEA